MSESATEIHLLVSGQKDPPDIGLEPQNLLQNLASLHQAAFNVLDQTGWSPSSIGEIYEGVGGMVFLATQNQRPVGFALLRLVLDEAELITLAVDPGLRRRGVARNILEFAIEHLATAGARSLFLEVREDNLAAARLYTGVGLHEIAVRRDYYKAANGKRINALVFRLEL